MSNSKKIAMKEIYNVLVLWGMGNYNINKNQSDITLNIQSTTTSDVRSNRTSYD